jgi:ubiquinone/menaquinone biosynthesis C-methylase UbiE/predicted metal-dependent enzyme (double-stranded beta helix superfamily)
MESIKKRIEEYSGEVTFETLKEFIQQLNMDDIIYQEHLVTPSSPEDYGRKIFTLEPFECVLIHWPKGLESAVHHHAGLFGYVWVIEGEINNIFYRENDGKLEEFAIQRYVKGGLIPEPDGVIHKICNASKDASAVTIHFYHPALHSMEGLKIFNLEEGKHGILSDQAESACWKDEPGHFLSVTENAFEYVSFEDLNHNKSHFISNVIPKPSAERIKAMNSAYFSEQAHKYDFSDFNLPSRKSYVDKIDSLIGEELSRIENINQVLDVACGTGRRALHIRELSGKQYDITGADISEEMCKIAESRGLRTFYQDWLDNRNPLDERFDIATFLYAFGHIPNYQERLETLIKINSYLEMDGLFFIDLFNINNKNEWGPLAMDAYAKERLEDSGYDAGDVFYRKRDCEELAFVHYFDIERAEMLMEQAGFEILEYKLVGYAKNAGEILDSDDGGNYFIKARKVKHMSL